MYDLVGKSLDKTSEVYARVRDKAIEGVYVYGAGFVGSWSVGYLERLGIPVAGFIDSDSKKWGAIISGKRVFSLEESKGRGAKVILIGSRHAVPTIRNLLASMSATVMSVDAFVVHQQGREEISKLESLFAHDQYSIRMVRAILLSMLEGTTAAIEELADNRPFFDKFGFFNRSNEIFVDAGAYVGDSVERFIWSVNGVFKHIHAFEPGITQYLAMEHRIDRLIAEWSLLPGSISLINKGVSDASRSVNIKTESHLTQTCINQAEQHPMDANAFDVVRTISLDEYFEGDPFTFLKVDIEGSESAMLDGAVRSIQKWRPRIALSIYHFPTDLFELPKKCFQLNCDYNFSIRHHSSQLMETVLYCRDKND